MPYKLENLIVDRVDLVDEGANSEAFIEFYKRKENLPMEFKEVLALLTAEHADVINATVAKAAADLKEATDNVALQMGDVTKTKELLATAETDLAAAKSEVGILKAKLPCECDGEADDGGACKVCGGVKKAASFDEEQVLKAMPAEARAVFQKMKLQKETAEAAIVKAKEEKADADAMAQATILKAIPVETAKLAAILKSCGSDVLDLLTTVNAAIETTVLKEIGGGGKGIETGTANEAWDKIEAEADTVAKAQSITKQKAIGIVIKSKPDLYKAYLNGGAN